jgi:hypothetical protein
VIPALSGIVLCPDGHDNTTGARFCGTCGVSLEEHHDREAVPA